MSDWCKYPNQCGLGWDCSECMSEELSRRENCIKRLQARADLAAERERERDLVEALRGMVDAWDKRHELDPFSQPDLDQRERAHKALAAYDEREGEK